MKHLNLVLAFVIFVSLQSYSQGFVYSSVTESIQVYNPLGLYGGGVSFYDFNKDGFDDLTFCVNNDSIICYQNLGGDQFFRSEILPNVLDAKQPTWVDYDNDGDADLMISKRNSGLKLYRNDGYPTFTDVTDNLDVPMALSAASYGCAWADYDVDGYLDCYVANYNWGDGIVNWLFHNNGDGTFEEVAAMMGVDNGSLPSYQAAWVDFNFDQLPDLYVVNDKYTGNAMYQNTGFGFILISDTNGSDVALDGMSNSITDYDNDGDFDIYIANDTEDNVLLRNDNGVFTDVAASSGVGVNALCWGSLWIDFNNNTYEDLLVNTTSPGINNNQNNFYINQQNGNFTLNNSIGLNGNDYNSYANAKGDWNNDGFYDMIITNSFNATAALYTNNGIGEKSIRYSLEGTVSNRDAVGTLLETYVNGNSYIRYTMCGENYISQDSQYEIVGTGDVTKIDSLIITWPSGFKEKYGQLFTQLTHHFVEGGTLTASITFPGAANICGSDTILLDAGEWSSYLWSTGSTDQVIEVSEEGEYSVVVYNEYGVSAEVSVQVVEVPPTELTAQVVGPSCYGVDDGYIVINTLGDPMQAALWNSEIVGSTISNLGPGTFACEVITVSGCVLNGLFELEYPDPIGFDYEVQNVLCFGESSGSVDLSIFGGTGAVTPHWDNLNPDALAAGNYEILIEDENGCSETVEFEIEQPTLLEMSYDIIQLPCFGSSGSINLIVSGGTEPYSSDIQGVDLAQISPGEYIFTTTDANACTSELNLILEENPEITASFNSNDANNGNNGSAQIIVSGGDDPYQYLWSNGSLSSVASSLGQGTYTCTVTDEQGCEATFEVEIIDVTIEELHSNNLLVYPIPCIDWLCIDPVENTFIEITSVDGKLIYRNTIYGKTIIDSSDWAPGIYLVNKREKVVKL